LRSQTAIRILYQLFAIVFTAFILNIYSGYLQQFISIQYSFYFELAMVIGQPIFQSIFLWKERFSVKLKYWFHLLTVSLLGSLLLLLFIGLKYLVNLSIYIALFYFLGVVVFMFLEHKRRVVLLKLPWYLSFTWLLYRSFILIYIL
jgi:hypothetical protein